MRSWINGGNADALFSCCCSAPVTTTFPMPTIAHNVAAAYYGRAVSLALRTGFAYYLQRGPSRNTWRTRQRTWYCRNIRALAFSGRYKRRGRHARPRAPLRHTGNIIASLNAGPFVDVTVEDRAGKRRTRRAVCGRVIHDGVVLFSSHSLNDMPSLTTIREAHGRLNSTSAG